MYCVTTHTLNGANPRRFYAQANKKMEYQQAAKYSAKVAVSMLKAYLEGKLESDAQLMVWHHNFEVVKFRISTLGKRLPAVEKYELYAYDSVDRASQAYIIAAIRNALEEYWQEYVHSH